jgi:Xaa-Pro dipeptidase
MAGFNEIGAALREAGLDGWLLYDFRGSDPLAYRILGLREEGLPTRRWFCFIPAEGEPRALVSAVEPHRLDALGAAKSVYRSADEMLAGVRTMLAGSKRIAMNYSPDCAIPYVSRVDAGTVELVRSLGVEIVSAADLIQRFEATLTAGQFAGHRRAVTALKSIVDETFAEIARLVRDHRPCSEVSMQAAVINRFAGHGLITDHPPIVAVNADAADPHFAPGSERDRAIGAGDLVLLDLWAKEPGLDSIYGDLTWMAYVGARVPEEYARLFAIVAAARDAAVELISRRVEAGQPITGAEADRATREVIARAGFGEYFVHRTGHSIGREVHGTGANLDSLETFDHRRLIEGTCFSVEPGIYIPWRFGVRSELDMAIEGGRATVSAGIIQREIIPILR